MFTSKLLLSTLPEIFHFFHAILTLGHVLTKEVNLRNAVLLRSVFLLAEVGLIDKCHLSYKQKLLGTEEYEYETHDTRKSR